MAAASGDCKNASHSRWAFAETGQVVECLKTSTGRWADSATTASISAIVFICF